jgi:hypothetical protein
LSSGELNIRSNLNNTVLLLWSLCVYVCVGVYYVVRRHGVEVAAVLLKRCTPKGILAKATAAPAVAAAGVLSSNPL